MNEPTKTKPRWRAARRILVVLAVLATLIAIFYTEEDLRGKLAWEQCKRQLEAQGIELDWDKFLPPPVPDDQNFYTASTNILLRFKQHSDDDTNEIEAARQLQWLRLVPEQTNGVRFFPLLDTGKGVPIIVARITILSSAYLIGLDSNTLILSLDDPEASARARQLIQSTVGQTIHGAQGFEFSERKLANIFPAHIFIKAKSPPSVGDLAAFIPSDTIGEKGGLRIVPTADPGAFQVQLTRNIQITAAADYLAWSDQFVPAFDEIREALKRPDAILPGDYSAPFRMPIPNFVTMRALAQTLAQRAECDFLLGKPDQALHELTLMHDVCRILEKPPTGQPETLVEAMINVAVSGLYVQVVAEGMKRQAWQEPQLEALQEQLKNINLPPIVFGCLREDVPAFAARDEETLSPQKWLTIMGERTSWPARLFWLVPRGWVYQNIVVTVQLEQPWCNGFDVTNGTVFPQKLDASTRKIQRTFDHHSHSPFYVLASMAIPNISKASETTAYNQTLVNEAQIACALERCRLAHGDYPDTLEALVPGYIASIPQDIIDGQPLHYRRSDDGKFLLYSVGWNERDDGGKTFFNDSGSVNSTRGDWVWMAGVHGL